MTPVSAQRPVLFVNNYITPAHLAQIAQAIPELELVYASPDADREPILAAVAERVKVLLTVGVIGLSARDIDRMPQLSLVCALGAGYEKLDIAYAKSKGIATANGAGTNDSCVADHTMALVLSSVRNLKYYEAQLRQGVWRENLVMPQGVTGKRLGIVGLGRIGQKIALRAQAFEMQVGYYSRSAKPDVPWSYFERLEALAHWADVLVVAVPGGADTYHLIDARILQALGSQGHLVNIGRGSVVDTAALADALRQGVIAGAALDVYESEPHPPAQLVELPNVVLTQHVAGWSAQSVQATVDRFIGNVRCHLEGKPLISPI